MSFIINKQQPATGYGLDEQGYLRQAQGFLSVPPRAVPLYDGRWEHFDWKQSGRNIKVIFHLYLLWQTHEKDLDFGSNLADRSMLMTCNWRIVKM